MRDFGGCAKIDGWTDGQRAHKHTQHTVRHEGQPSITTNTFVII